MLTSPIKHLIAPPSLTSPICNIIYPQSIRIEPTPPNKNPNTYLYVLPVLFLEYLALSVTRAILPSLMVKTFGKSVYFVTGISEAVKGILAFFACPYIGKISDIIGRKTCLFATVLFTLLPVSSLSLTFFLFNFDADDRIKLFVVLLSLSGIFASTFTVTFAYISDCVPRESRVGAYGLALATFGFSFTIGPMLGGYLSSENEIDDIELAMNNITNVNEGEVSDDVFISAGEERVFMLSLLLVVLDLLYIQLVLPESLSKTEKQSRSDLFSNFNPMESILLLKNDPFLKQIGVIVFLYYTSLWAIISTLSIYVTTRFDFGPRRLGELISAFGFCSMFAEGVLVRIVVPVFGERMVLRVGLLAFTCQCLVFAIVWEGWQIFLCLGFTILANLVYPSITSLVSGAVESNKVGEALGSINGIKALTEGIGPLTFSLLMSLFEDTPFPGAPYVVAAMLSHVAYYYATKLMDEDDMYISEKFEMRSNLVSNLNSRDDDDEDDDEDDCIDEKTSLM